MPTFAIYTAGPVMKFTGTTDQVKEQVEKYAKLKRGWTGKWEGLTYRRFNSKGAHKVGWDVRVVPVPFSSITARTAHNITKPIDLSSGM